MRNQGYQSRDSKQNIYSESNRDTYHQYNQIRREQSSSSPYSHLRSPSHEEALRIEQRHEELKRQIALKEKQLADMTGERDTINALRNKLGLKDFSYDESQRNDSQSKKNFDQGVSRRGNLLSSSVSPDHSMPSMVGMKSTTIGRGISQERTAVRNKANFQEEREPVQLEPSQRFSSQQLQFHPTRIPAAVRRVQPETNNTSHSPLRHKSSDREDSSSRYVAPEPRQYDFSNRHSLSRGKERSSNSPLRQHYTVPIREEPIESSDNYADESDSKSRFNVQRISTQEQQQYISSERPIVTQIPQNARDKLYRERIETMTLDNQSLQRRLNQVSNELERIQRENEAISRQIQMVDGDVQRYNNLINNKDDVDGQNNILQQDLDRMKSTNLDLNHNLKEEENKTQEVSNKLGLASANVKSLEIDYDTLNHDMRQKIQRFDAISKERASNVQRLSKVNAELERLSREDLTINHENIEIEARVAKLQQDRHELLIKIERITKTFDGTVRELTYGKRNMDRDNCWHTKLIVTKNMHVALDLMVKRRRQIIFNEINNYSVFDGLCHQKLRNLANTMEKVGKYKLMVGLNQWYDKALKPRRTILQNEDLVMLSSCQKLNDRVFYALKQYVFEKQEVYHYKQKSIESIWHRLVTDQRKEKKRAFDIWKQKRIFEIHQFQKLRRVVQKMNQRKLEQAMYSWLRYSQELEYHCRIKLLQKDFTKKVFMTQTFGEFKHKVRFMRQKRQRTLNHFFKAWQDNIQYNRHLMQANIAAITFRNKNSEFTLQCCFNALKNYTEQSKYTLLKHAVQQDMDIVISETAEFNQQKEQQLLTKNQLRAGNITRDVLGKKLFSYFEKWRNETYYYRVTMNDKVRIKIIKVYLRLMNSYFKHWKKNCFDKQTRAQMKIVFDLQQQSEQIANEVMKKEKQIKQKVEGVKTFQRRVSEKIFKKCINRLVAQALNRWRDKCVDRQNKQLRSEFIFKKIKKRWLREAFDMYLAFLNQNLQEDRNEGKADNIQDKLKTIEKRKLFRAMKRYTEWGKRVKRVWSKVLYRFDFFQKQRAIKRWNANQNKAHEQKLKNQQHEMINFLSEQNNEMQQYIIDTKGQKDFIGSQEETMRRKAYRQIGNMFLRLYTDQTSQKFNLWKQKSLIMKQKERIMRRSIEHFQRNYLEAVQRVFLRFMNDERRKERLEEIKNKCTESFQLEEMIKTSREKYAKAKASRKLEIGETNCVSKETEKKVLHTMECMAKRNMDWVYRSKKRMIFEMWRTVGKEERAFAYSVKNVIMKSLLQEGFTRIKYQSRDIDYTNKVHRALIRFSLKRSKGNMGNSFTKWKKFAFSKVENRTEEVRQNFENQLQEFQNFRDAAQAKNFERVTNFFIEKNSANIFRAWKNVIKHIKLVKSKTKEFHSRQDRLQRKFGLQVWNMRTSKTIQNRQKTNLLIAQFQRKYMKAAFREMRFRYLTTKSLTDSLHHLEMTMRTKIFGDAFKNLKSYSISKSLVQQKGSQTGGVKSKQILRNFYLRLIGRQFDKFKSQCSMGNEDNQVFRSIYGKVGNKRLRDAFNWWKKKHSLEVLKQELHETGPVRAEHWLAEREIENIKDFMRDQHYTELEINKFYNDVDQKNQYLMYKHMIRMKYKLDPSKRLLYQVMDRWKGFVAIRKNVKHQFRFLANFKESQKAEMQLAFNKWRRGNDKLEQELWRLDYKTLEQIGLRTSEELKDCSDQITENQAINNHLVLQRDEFLNYYIKGQILAMALIKDRNAFAEMQSVSRWTLKSRKNEIAELRQNIRDEEYLYANLQEKEIYLGKHNNELIEENAEMEQFKADGEIIQHNKDKLINDVSHLKDQLGELDEELKQLQEMQFELMAAIQEEEEKIKENKSRGYVGKFQEDHKKATIKNQPNQRQDVIRNEEETEEERKMRERMEQLSNLSRVGPALR